MTQTNKIIRERAEIFNLSSVVLYHKEHLLKKTIAKIVVVKY